MDSGVTLSNSSTDAVTVNSQTSGVSIVNNGTISDTKSGSRAIRINGATQTNLTITNNGTITASGDDAIHAGSSSTPVTSGSLTVTNYGTISSTGTTSSTNGQAIDFDNTSGSVVISITNYGTISAADSDAIRPGANATIYNYGTITGSSVNGDTGNDGIDFQSHAGGTVYNYEGATITGARHGITGSGSITVENAGSITGLLGSGINIDSTSGTTTIVNYSTGVITGNAGGSSDGDGIDVDYLVVIKNYGKIYAYGTSTAGLSEAITVGGGEIDNYSSGLIYSVQRAITVDDSNGGNAFGATTINNAGTITGADGEAISITSTYANTIVNSGTINGSIVITSASGTTAGDNTITNTGTINGSVTTGGGNDTFNLYTGSSITGGIDGGAGNDVINLLSTTSSGKGTLSGVTNVETLNVQSGIWTISDTEVYSSGVTIADGAALTVNGSLAGSAVTVEAGGVLGGDGTVGSVSVLSGGTISPGNSPGTLTVSGDYSQASGSTYRVEVVPGSSTSDSIVVSGTATLASGAILDVVRYSTGTYDLDSRYTILTATGGVSGTFTLVGDTVISTFYTLAAAYDANDVYLVASQTRAFTAAATTSNQTAVASGLQSLAAGNSLRNAVGVLQDDASARVAFDRLSGEVHASLRGVLVEDSAYVRTAAIDRLRAAFGDGVAHGQNAACIGASTRIPGDCPMFWMQGFGAWGKANGNGNAAALSHDIGGFFAGADSLFFDSIRIGALGGYSRTSFDGSQSAAGTIDGYTAGAYGGGQWGAVGLRLGAAYTGSQIATSRSASFSGFENLLSSKYAANTAQVFADVGRRVELGKTPFGMVALEPFAGLAYVDVWAGSFTEKGGLAALTGVSGNTSVAFSTLGLRASNGFALGGLDLKATSMLAWRHGEGDITPKASLSFAGSDVFQVSGVPIARDAVVVDAGLSTVLARNLTLGASYSGQFGSGTRKQGLRGQFSWAF